MGESPAESLQVLRYHKVLCGAKTIRLKACDAQSTRGSRSTGCRKTIVIVGGGFCGTVLAANLLRRPPADPTDVVLIERGAAMGRGVAYAAHDFPYLLNVPAGRLSAASEDPLQFLRFGQQSLPHADAEDFLPRAVYGDYLQDVLLQATAPGRQRRLNHARRNHSI
jgi:uncharacterized NAD(P)/FAD-binding protein YdhS